MPDKSPNQKTYNHAYYLAHRDEIQARTAAYRKAHRGASNASTRKWRSKNRTTMNTLIAAFRAQRRKWITSLLAGKACKYCGAKQDLLFHHVDPMEKLASVSKMDNRSRSAVLAEIKKCVVLCRSCHMRHHRRERLKKAG